jgi:hypothetical protein
MAYTQHASMETHTGCVISKGVNGCFKTRKLIFVVYVKTKKRVRAQRVLIFFVDTKKETKKKQDI